MKRFFYNGWWRTVFFATMCGIGCNGDEEAQPTFALSFDGRDYALRAGLITDFGPRPFDGGLDEERIHYNYEIELVDAEYESVTIDSTEYYRVKTGTFALGISMDLLSPDTTGFRPGVFEYMPADSLRADAVRGKYYFTDIDVVADTDGNRLIGPGEEDGFVVVGGTVSLTGGGRDYTVAFDLTVTGGKPLKGQFSGTLLYQDER